MIVVVGRVRTDAARRKALIDIGQTLARASRTEDGCLGYRLYEDIETPNDFVFVEEWESDEALQRHFTTPHIAAFLEAVPNVLAAAPDVQFHTVSRSRGLADVSSGPPAD